MDLSNKEYSQIELRLIRTIFTLCTKEYSFSGYQTAIFDIRDIKQQDSTFVYLSS